MADWTPDQVAERFREAAETAHRLPGLRSQCYFSVWPSIQRERWEGYVDAESRLRCPPSPEAIDRMEEVQRWVLWLRVEQRHLLWMRADNWSWKDITRAYGCDRTTAWRHWRKALTQVARRLREA